MRGSESRFAGASARRATPARGLALAVLLVAALAAAGCGRGRPREAGETAGGSSASALDSLAAEVQRQLELGAGEASRPGEARGAVDEAVQALVLAVLASERPAAGWTPAALESALWARRLTVQVRETESGGKAWLALALSARRTGAADLALLVFPESGSLARLQLDPFLHPFQLAAWTDERGPALLVAGTRRSPGGAQPAAWLFRLPERAPAATESVPFLDCVGEWGLAAAGPAHASFTREDSSAVPRLVVSRSALPNPLFDECPACPHLEADVEYRLEDDKLVADKPVVRRTPYAAFVGFVQALADRDDAAAARYAAHERVLEHAHALGLDRRPEGGLWRIAPGTSPISLDQVYVRGREGAFRVLFTPRDSGFVVTSISPTTFELD